MSYLSNGHAKRGDKHKKPSSNQVFQDKAGDGERSRIIDAIVFRLSMRHINQVINSIMLVGIIIIAIVIINT